MSSSEPPSASGAEASPLALIDVAMPGAAPRQLLLDQRAVEVGGARAAVLLGRVRVHEAELPRLAQHFLRPRAVPVVLPGDWTDLLGGEVVRHLAQRLLLVGQGEVDHGLSAPRLTGQSTTAGADGTRRRVNTSRPFVRNQRSWAAMDDAFLIVVIGVSLLGVRRRGDRAGDERRLLRQHRPRRAVDRRGPAGPARRPRPPGLGRRARRRDPPVPRGPQRPPRRPRRAAGRRRGGAARADGAGRGSRAGGRGPPARRGPQRPPRSRAGSRRWTSRPRSRSGCGTPSSPRWA